MTEVRGDHDPERIVWAAMQFAAADGEVWHIMRRSGDVETVSVFSREGRDDLRTAVKPYRCWPWSHEYVRRYDWDDILNQGSVYGGSWKSYMCRRCSKPKIKMPWDAI